MIVLCNVFCHNCEPDEDGVRPEMVGADRTYVNREAKTQSRLFVCPECDNHVSVLLVVDKD